MITKKHLLQLIAVAGFFATTVAAHADKGGNGNGNNGNGGGNGGPNVGSPEPAAIVTFMVLAGVAVAAKRKFSKTA